MQFSDTKMIFGDLKAALEELKNNRKVPVTIRRAFGQFLTLTQQLTEAMRKEYKSLTGKEWNASSFSGWNKITELFKELRRTDYHEFPVVINVRESQYYVAEVYEDENGNELYGYMVPTVTWGLGDPFSETIPSGMSIVAYDENHQPIEGVEPEKIEYQFILHPRTKKIENLLKTIGTDDIHELSERCFESLKIYYEYYNDCVSNNRRK